MVYQTRKTLMLKNRVNDFPNWENVTYSNKPEVQQRYLKMIRLYLSGMKLDEIGSRVGTGDRRCVAAYLSKAKAKIKQNQAT